jgi:IMP dehydrogenase
MFVTNRQLLLKSYMDLTNVAAPTDLDGQFYQKADEFFRGCLPNAVTYDDVSLATDFSQVLPRDTDLQTRLSESVLLRLPILSADMDTVTESRMAIEMSLNGGMGLIHSNMTREEQVREVAEVKRHIHGLIRNPATIPPNLLIGDVLQLSREKSYNFTTFPVADEAGRLLGLLPGKIVRERYSNRRVDELMTPSEEIFTIREDEMGSDPIGTADRFFTENPGIHKILVTDAEGSLTGLFTLTDIERIMSEARADRRASRDSAFRLLAGAAVAPLFTKEGEIDQNRVLEHVANLCEVSVDAVAVSSAHAFTAKMGEMVRLIRQEFADLTIIAGNVTTGAGVEFLAECGADAVKVGQGPGSICTTRMVAGVGIPQLTALYIARKAAENAGVAVIADGGINKSGDCVKALTLADGVLCGGLLAGCQEAPGEIIEIEGKRYKQYRGMGSLSAMQKGSAARYGHGKSDSNRKIAAEGIEALKEVSGSVGDVLNQLTGGIRSGMGYLGARNLQELREKARYIRVTPAGMAEARPHDVIEIAKKSS